MGTKSHTRDMPGINQLLKSAEKDEKQKVDKKADSYLSFFKNSSSGDSSRPGHSRSSSTEYKQNGHVRNKSIDGAKGGHSRNSSISEKSHSRNSSTSEKSKSEKSLEMTRAFYDLVTDFYEYGWGESFHFCQMKKGETLDHAFAKMEYRLALKLGLKATDKVLDIGCGIGGPARHISSFSEAHITGLNYNRYQIQRCVDLTKKANLDHLCDYVQGDFNHMHFEDETFDHAYAIEATCHAEDKTKVYGEAFRILKPGGVFAFYEWIMTDKYDPHNKYHRQIKHDILEGNGLPNLESPGNTRKFLQQVGFEVLETTDLAPMSELPWYYTLETRWTLSDFKMTPPGRFLTHMMLSGMEMIGLAPKGSMKVHKTLLKAADGLVKGGKEEIFTPMFLCVARKPIK